MRRKILAVAAALVLGTATMVPDTMATARGGGGHGFSGGHRGHSYRGGYRRGYGRGLHGRGYGYGLYWYPDYGYDYGPNYGYDYDVTSVTPPPVTFVPEPPRAPIICRETVTVPSEDGGTRQIRIIRC